MLNLVVTWFFSAVLLFITSRIIDGFQIPDLGSALFVCIIIGLINVFIRPLIAILALPINIVTLGLFSLVINAVVLKLADGLTKSLTIDGWGTAILAALFLSILQMVANVLMPGKQKFIGRE